MKAKYRDSEDTNLQLRVPSFGHLWPHLNRKILNPPYPPLLKGVEGT